MTRVGEAAGEDPRVEGCGNSVADDDAADRDVAGVGALREDDEIGLDVPVLEREPSARAAEAGHRLVGDHDDAVLVAECSHALEVAGWGHEHSGRANDAFDEDGADGAGSLELNDLLEVLKSALALLSLRGCPEGRAVEVGAKEVDMLRRVLIRPAAGVAGRGDGSSGVAVVRAVEREHLVLVRVDAGHADRVLDCIGAAVGEEHLVHVVGDETGDELRRFAPRRVGVLRGNRRQLRGLILNRLDDLRMLVADVDVDELR
ncbi:unannotated protein [freshwater metagenome]|uniref:Unannotated protein n=1 Tax=freshwater metagenome TaxID=449393 RepID=A0A6J7M765_9ZZZZ